MTTLLTKPALATCQALGLGPGLQLFDALLIGQVFQRIWRGVVALMALEPSYVLWTEGFVQRENSHPAGSVTSGLRYPFLNGMEWPDRMSFYLLYRGVALGILTTLAAANWLVCRLSAVIVLKRE